MDVQFDIKDERIRKIIEQYKSTIAKIQGEIEHDDDYLKMKDQLDGIKVEIDKIEYDYDFYEYYKQQSQEQ